MGGPDRGAANRLAGARRARRRGGPGGGAALAGPPHRALAGGRARRPGPGAPVVVHRGRRSGAPILGGLGVEPVGAQRAAARTARARLPPRRDGPRARLARPRPRGARRHRGRAGGVAARGGVRVRSGQDRGAHRGGSVRRSPVHPGGPALHGPAQRRGGRRAHAGRLRRAPDPRGGPLHGHRAPRARGLRTRLPRPRVREGGQALRALRRRGDGRALHRRRRAPRAPDGRHRLGPGHREGQTCRARHGRRARPALHRADVGAGLCLRPGHAVAARARGRVPVPGDARSAARDRGREARHGAARADGSAALRRRRVRQDGGRGPRRVQGGDERQAGGRARARRRCSPSSTC